MTQLRRKKVPGETVFKEIVRNNKLHKIAANKICKLVCVICRKSCPEQENENKIIKKNCLQKNCQNLQKKAVIIPKFAKWNHKFPNITRR